VSSPVREHIVARDGDGNGDSDGDVRGDATQAHYVVYACHHLHVDTVNIYCTLSDPSSAAAIH
jgi:hypothetical protein